MKKKTNGIRLIFLSLSAVSTLIGLLSGFLYSYKGTIEAYDKYSEVLIATRQYQQILRKEVKDNAEKKMDKSLAWQQLNNLSNRVEYLERHLGDKK